MHGHKNEIFCEAGFRSGGRVNDVTWNRERLGTFFCLAKRCKAAKRRPPATTSYLPEFSPLSASCSTTVRLWIKPCTRIEEARSSIDSPPDLRTMRAERVSLFSGTAMILGCAHKTENKPRKGAKTLL